MTKIICYETDIQINPEKVEVMMDEWFYYHHGKTPEDWKNFLEDVKKLPEIIQKIEENKDITEKETYIHSLYYGKCAPILEAEPDGRVTISDGRHRMQALKELNISIPMHVNSYVMAEPVKNISDLYKTKDFLFFKKDTNEIKDDINYIAIRTVSNNYKKLDTDNYFISKLKDELHNETYAFVSRNEIKNEEGFKIKLEEFQKHNIEIYAIKDKNIYKGEEK